MSLSRIKLKPQRPERIGHPWIFDNEIANGPDAGFENGGLVRIFDAHNHALGIGYFNRKSKISVRYLSRHPDTVIDAAFWHDRIAKAYQYRQVRYLAEGGLPPAYRLVHGESDGIPGLVVDIYGDYAVPQFLALGLEKWRGDIVNAITRTVGIPNVYERSDSTVRRLEGLEERVGVICGDAPPEFLEFEDDGVAVLADLKTGGKTGLFLDQRDNQRAAAREAGGRRVLNCFAYTGLFSLRGRIAQRRLCYRCGKQRRV